LVAAVGVLLAVRVFAISPTDPMTYLGVGLGLLSVSTLAVYVPARRAGRADPAELLRD
jgi:ABC-type lipoprotein release transport system permease subunit